MLRWLATIIYLVIVAVVLILYATGKITVLPTWFVIAFAVSFGIVFFIIGVKEGRGKK